MMLLTRRSTVSALLAAPLVGCHKQTSGSVTVAEIAVQVPMAMLYLARLNGYWKEAGIDLDTASFSSGRLALDALLGRAASFSGSAVTPLALAALQRGNYRILTQVSVSPNELSLVTRRTSKIAAPADLLGKKVAYPLGTQAEYFFDRYLALHKLDKAAVTIVAAAPPDCVSAIAKGEVDAIVAFRPHSLKAAKQLGDNAGSLDTRGLYTSIASLICEASVSEKQPEVVDKILRGLIKAEEYIARSPERAMLQVANEVKLDPALLSRYFSDYSFKVGLSPPLLAALQAEGDWGSRSRKGVVQPNYRDFIADKHLRAIDPKRVTL